MRRIICALVILVDVQPAFAQHEQIERYVREHQGPIMQEFIGLLSIPNVQTDAFNIKRNTEYLRQMLDRRGMKPEIWETPSTPLVYGERLVPGASRTILFYLHYDGQPVEKHGGSSPIRFSLSCALTAWKQARRTSISLGSQFFQTAGVSTPARPAMTKDLYRPLCQLSTR